MSFTSARRDLLLVVAARAVTFLGDELAAIALVLRLQGSGAGAGAVAALLAANLAPMALLCGWAGRLVDRRDNRRLLVVTSAAQAVVCAVLVVAHGTALTLVLVALLGAGQAVSGAAWQALLPTLVAPERLSRAVGLSQSVTTAAGIAAPALAGLLVAASGTRVPLLLDAASFAAVMLAALALRVRRAPGAAGGPLPGGLAVVRANRVLTGVVLLLGTFVLLGSMVNVVDVFLVRETLHASTLWYGLVGAGYMVGLLAGAQLGGRTLAAARAQARGLVGCSAGLALGLVGMGLSPAVTWLIVASVATGCANGVLNVAATSLLMGTAAPEERGRVGAVLSGVVSGTQLAAYALGGVLAGALEPRAVFVLGGVLGLLAPLALGRRLLVAVGASPARPPLPTAACGDTVHAAG